MTDPYQIAYADLLKDLAQRGMCQQEVAKWLGVAPETISRRKRGHLPVTFETWCALLWCSHERRLADARVMAS